MSAPHCTVPRCRRFATWKQYHPASAELPSCLCTEHWRELRMAEPDAVYERYGSIHLVQDPRCEITGREKWPPGTPGMR